MKGLASHWRARLLAWPRWLKRSVALAVDAVLCVLTVWLALVLRYEALMPLTMAHLWAMMGSIALALPIFTRFGLYAAVFRYNGRQSALALAKATALYGVLYALIFTAVGVPGVPRSVGLLQPILLFMAVLLTRTAVRLWLGDEYRALRNRAKLPGLVIYGAGSAGRQLASLVERGDEYRLVGFLDDDAALQGRLLEGRPVHHPKQLPLLVAHDQVRELILAIPSASAKRRREILESLRPFPVHVRILPHISQLLGGRVSLQDVREIEIDDLLGRTPVPPDPALMHQDIQGATVLVTGAGGSIGSELCRQIIRQGPQCLLLLESSEYALYRIHTELEEWLRREQPDGAPPVIPLLGSVQDEARMREVMTTWRPRTVYHAAAYKHVPLVEHNVLEGVRNNVWGTWVCARAAIECGVAKFVLISTDKAVRPTNVMGASKRLAEMVLQALAAEGRHNTCLTMVRFGNVLGSSGSVVPRFREQIAAGGPVTLTHPEVTRYFMTIPEAAQLVIQAGAMATGGEVFLLDMGEPVRIADLARRMIELSGRTVKDEQNPQGEIAIEVTGLRPGEKLYEELLVDDTAERSQHPRIMRAREGFVPSDTLWPSLSGVKAAIEQRDVDAVIRYLHQLVEGYRPAGRA